MKDILLTTINAKWIHPSLALRLLKANLGELEDRCEVIEFTLRQPLNEKIDALTAAQPRILGISVSIWNHTATLELLRSLLPIPHSLLPIIILGGPEVSHLPQDAEIFKYADHVICGEGEIAFRELCETILADGQAEKFITAHNVDVTQIKSAYHLYTDEDVARKLIYVEASRGCPFNCEFCLSAADKCAVREFPLEPFLAQMDILISRSVKTFKFLDRTFNANIKRAIQICEFFLEKINERQAAGKPPLTVHFEMVPSLFPPALREVLVLFPPGTLRLEIGIQTLNDEAAARIGLPARDGALETLRFLVEKTNAIIHADLIAGLPGEDLASFGKGFDRLCEALTCGVFSQKKLQAEKSQGDFSAEVQVGILKLLPGAPIARHNDAFGICYSLVPPYEVEETAAMSAENIRRVRNFARFWEIIVNRGLANPFCATFLQNTNFENFMNLSDSLYTRFGRNWGIDKNELLEALKI